MPIVRTAEAESVVSDGPVLAGCSVVLGNRRCGKPGEPRFVMCVHEHFAYLNNEPIEICDVCARFILNITCKLCRHGKKPHDCKLQIYRKENGKLVKEAT